MHDVEAGEHFVGGGRIEGNAVIDDIARGTLQALLDGFLGDEQGTGDLMVAQAAQRLERQRELVLAARWGWQQANIIRSWLSAISASRNSVSMPSSRGGRISA